MKNYLPTALSIITLSFLLSACSESTQNSVPQINTQQTDQGVSDFNTDITIREIMSSLVDPHADALWNAVRVISDENGITEYFPETEEEWAALRISAVSIIEGSNSLMMPGRAVARPGAVGIFPEFEFTPEEVAARLATDFQSWAGFSQGLQDAAIGLLNAVDAKDTDALSEWGFYLDEACEACHSTYWYRAGI